MFEIKKILIKVKNSEFLKDSFYKYYFDFVKSVLLAKK